MGVSSLKYFEIPDSSWFNLDMVYQGNVVVVLYQKRAHRESYPLSYISTSYCKVISKSHEF